MTRHDGYSLTCDAEASIIIPPEGINVSVQRFPHGHRPLPAWAGCADWVGIPREEFYLQVGCFDPFKLDLSRI